MDKVFGGLPYALAIMLTTSFTKGFCTFTDRVFISPSVPTDNFDLPMENWFTIGTDRTDGQGFWGLPYALAIMLTTSFTKGFCTFTDRVFISPSVPTDNFDLPMDNWFTICTDRTDGQGFWGLPYALAIMLTTSFTKGFCTFTDRVFISPSVPTDNFDLPMENWFTIGTDRTDGQGFWGLPYALAIMLTTSFTKGFCTFTDRVFISPSVPTDNFDLPVDKWFTICTDRTDGQGFWGLPYALAIMLTTSFTKGFCTFTDRVFISPSVPTDNFDLPMENWFTIGTDRTDRQGFWGLPYALAIMLTTSFTKAFCTFTDRVFIPPSVPTDNFDLPMDNWFTICTDRTDGQGFWGLPYALAIMLTTSFTKGFCTFTDRVFISPSVPTDNFDLPMENWFTIGTDRTDGQGFWGLPYALAIMLTTSFTKGFCTFTDRVFISPSVPTDNFDLPMDNWFTICTDRTDGQGFWGLPYALAIMLTTSFTKGFCTFTDRVFISPSVPTDNFDLPMENWFTIGTDRTDGQGFWGLPYALAIMLTTSFTKGFCTFTDRVFISPSVPTDNFDLPVDKWFTICTDRTDGQGFWGLPYALAIMLTTSFTKGFCTFTDRVFISPSVPTDNFDLPMENWFTIGTDRTDRQGFWGLPYALAIMLTTSFTKAFCTFTDRVFIPPSVPTDNFDLPMDNWFTICTDRTDGQGFWGLPYSLAIMLTTSFTKGFCTFTDRVVISPSVPTDTDGRNNFT